LIVFKSINIETDEMPNGIRIENSDDVVAVDRLKEGKAEDAERRFLLETTLRVLFGMVAEHSSLGYKLWR